MIDANNLIKKTLGLPVVTSAIQKQQNYSPLDNVSPNNSRPTSRPSRITRKLLSLSNMRRKSNLKKSGTKKRGL